MDFEQAASEVNEASRLLSGAAEEAMAGFRLLGKGAYADRVLSKKLKELIALAISISTRCDGCVAYHAKRVAELGASREEVAETIAVAVQMGGGPGMVYGGQALRAFDSFREAMALAAAG
jgi:AhpD family alkylhydroperoxidase